MAGFKVFEYKILIVGFCVRNAVLWLYGGILPLFILCGNNGN